MMEQGQYVCNCVILNTGKTREWKATKKMEEVIRCRDCKFSYNLYGFRCYSTQWSNPDESPEVDPDGFCAWAERDER